MTHNHMTAPDYRLQIPTHLQYLLVAGVGSGLVGLILIALLPDTSGLVAVFLIVIGVLALAMTTLLLLVTNERARLSARRTMMAAIQWRGDETILDVGSGNGFLLLEAAKHLTTGKAIGIDVWVEGSGGQAASVALQNARLEQVADKIDVQNVDARRMPFVSASFDVIMSSLALHHMGSNADREQALAEMVRVLKPGGTILLYDMFPMIGQASAVMRRSQFTQVHGLGGLILKVIAAKK